MISGYIKLWRETLDHEVFQDPDLWRLWCWCLMSASYLPTTWHGESIAAGEFATGRHSAAQQLQISPSKWVRGIDRLRELGCITTRSNNKWTTVSICNWSTYQSDVASDRTASGQPADGKQQQSDDSNKAGQPADNVKSNAGSSLRPDADDDSDSERTAGDTASGQPADTDKERKNTRKEEYKEPPNPLPGGTGNSESDLRSSSRKLQAAKQKFDPRSVPVPDSLSGHPEFCTSWELWLTHLASRRTKPTQVSIEGTLAQLAEWGPDRAIAAIKVSVRSNWGSVWESTQGARAEPRQLSGRHTNSTFTPIRRRKA